MGFLINAPGVNGAEFTIDLVSQLGQRQFSLWERPEGRIEIEGNITQQEAETVLAGHAARVQSNKDAEQTARTNDITERDAINAGLATINTYINTANAQITTAMTVNTLKLVCRITRWVITREARRNF